MAKEVWVLNDKDNEQLTGPFDSKLAALEYATQNDWGSAEGDGSRFGSLGWSAEILNPAETGDLAAGDHFAGMTGALSVEEATEAAMAEARRDLERGTATFDPPTPSLEDIRLATGRQAVIDGITEEIESGNAHLMTRNELKEFIAWITMGEQSYRFSDKYYEMLNSKDPVLEEAFVEYLAKEWFIKCGYEAAETHGEAADRLLRGGGQRGW